MLRVCGEAVILSPFLWARGSERNGALSFPTYPVVEVEGCVTVGLRLELLEESLMSRHSRKNLCQQHNHKRKATFNNIKIKGNFPECYSALLILSSSIY